MGGGYMPGIKQDITVKTDKDLSEEEINELIEKKLKKLEDKEE
jgi:hypothetical protein